MSLVDQQVTEAAGIPPALPSFDALGLIIDI
jgi:hypothetical protein